MFLILVDKQSDWEEINGVMEQLSEPYEVSLTFVFMDEKIDELQNLTKEQLRICRNYIFAKYGRIFKSEDLISYFSKYTWYNPQYESVVEELTPVDKNLIKTIESYETNRE